jgi:hypothetical protein
VLKLLALGGVERALVLGGARAAPVATALADAAERRAVEARAAAARAAVERGVLLENWHCLHGPARDDAAQRLAQHRLAYHTRRTRCTRRAFRVARAA